MNLRPFKLTNMKTLLLSCFAILVSFAGLSQKQFEGTIVYRLHSTEEKVDVTLTVSFSKNAVRLNMDEPGKELEKYVVIRFDSSKKFSISPKNKNYSTERLAEKQGAKSHPAFKQFAGFSARAIDIKGGNLVDALFSGLFSEGNVVMYVADSLYYPVPDKFSTANIELMFIRDNKIVLGADLTGGKSPWDDDEKDRKSPPMEITAEAISVKWETLPEIDFMVPADYTSKASRYDQELAAYDSLRRADSIAKVDYMEAKRIADSIAAAKAKPQQKTPAKTKQPVKLKPKTNTPGSPAKKPE